MLEIALVLTTIVTVGLLGFLTTIITPRLMTTIGIVMLTLGLFVGVPTGFWYHVLLYRVLSPRVALPPKWWWAPVDLHPLLTEQELARLKPWFTIGGIGFVLSIVGGLAAMAGLLAVVAGALWTFISGGGLGMVVVGLKVFPIVVIGGLDSVPGTIVGALFIGVLESMAAGYLDPVLGAGFSSVVSYAVLLGVLFVRPYGLCGKPDVERV